ncbi:MAG: hypothetical protein R3A10_00120 [Caldilineaceae bacterium]
MAQPAQATADEIGAIHKDWGGKPRAASTMPNTYYVGMSSLAPNFSTASSTPRATWSASAPSGKRAQPNAAFRLRPGERAPRG